MTAFKKLTPEETLLHVIENPEQINKMGAGRKGRRKIPLFPAFAAGMDIKKIGLRGVNKGLLWLSAVLTITLVGFFIRDGKHMGRRFDELKNKIISKSPFHIKEMQSEIPDISSYVVEVEAKNPFHVGEYTGIKETDAKAPKIVEFRSEDKERYQK